MSTKIYGDDSDDILSITSFFDGRERGRCLQLRIGRERVECIEDEVKEISEVINKWLRKET